MKARIKRWVKNCLAGVGSCSLSPDTRVLTYHSVGARDHDMNVTPDDFARQMDWLREHARPISLADAAVGKPGVAVTLDDGFADNWTKAAPILLAREIPATVFMVTARAGGVLDDERDLKRGRLMTWEELRAWRDAGLGVGGHTRSHVRLSHQAEERQREEIAGCFADLAERFGGPPEFFAYPYGTSRDYTGRTERLVEAAGFRAAFSNRYGTVQPARERWGLRRIWIDRTDDLPTFAAKVYGRLDALAMLDSRVGLVARRALNSALRRPGVRRRSEH